MISTKILCVLPSLGLGGAERVTITLMNQLILNGKDVRLFSMTAQNDLASWFINKNSIITAKPAHFFGGVFYLVYTIWKIKPDIVFSTIGPMNLCIMALRPLLPRSCKVVIREAIDPEFYLKGHFSWLWKIAFAQLYTKADLIISPSMKIIAQFKSSFGMRGNNYLHLSNPVDTTKIRKRANAEFKPKDSASLNYVSVGRLTHQKGFDRLINNLKIKPNIEWSLTILGEGEQRPELESLIVKNGLQSRVKLLGKVENPWAYIATADFLILPSRWEGLPNVVLESLALGAPVLAMNEAGAINEISELAGGNIMVVKDIHEMVEKMEQKKPDSIDALRTNILPQEFELENVSKLFLSHINSV